MNNNLLIHFIGGTTIDAECTDAEAEKLLRWFHSAEPNSTILINDKALQKCGIACIQNITEVRA